MIDPLEGTYKLEDVALVITDTLAHTNFQIKRGTTVDLIEIDLFFCVLKV